MNRIREKLLHWYGKHRRDLPWRKTRDPYKIWVSEVMLQQTRVETVIPFYQKFLKAFPTVKELARAKEERVLKLWEGLGYYSRARNLRAAAKEVCETYGGNLPGASAQLRQLKGFGLYTSAAVASIAFNEPVACVDGNVRRVISRLFASHEGIEELAQKLIDPLRPSDFNQAMMELGALICLPKSPKCPSCPVQAECQAYQTDSTSVYPQKSVKPAVKKIWAMVIIAQRKGKIWIRPVPRGGKFAGLWEFPTFEGKSEKEALSGAVKAFPYALILSGKFIHVLTHRVIHASVMVTGAGRQRGKSSEGKWVSAAQLGTFPLSRLQQKVIEHSKIFSPA